MIGLFGDPVAWSAAMVKTWPRFVFFGLFLIGITAIVVYQATVRGWFSALGPAIFLAAYQLMLLYAMRRMYLRIVRPLANAV